MSAIALQRVMVRMLYDPAFTDRVLGDAATALADVDLTDEERAWLRGPDPRAWKVDTDRAHRSLTALLQQFPTAAALAVRATGEISMLPAFFRSGEFHHAVQDRGSLAGAFAAWLAARVEAGDVRDRRVLPLAALERAIARLHRAAGAEPPPAGSGGARFRLSPDKALHVAEGGTADLHEAIHAALAHGRDLPYAVLDQSIALPPDPVDPARREPLLLELVRDDGPRVRYAAGAAEITEGLHALLAFAGTPREFAGLVAEITRLGADPEEAPEIVTGLIEEGMLVAAP